MGADKNKTQSNDKSLRTVAIVAGLGLLVMAILGAFANFSVIQGLVVPGDAQAMLFLDAFSLGWALALVVFGFHLLLIGYLAFQAGYVPKWLGTLLVVAGLGYLADSLAKFLIPDSGIAISQFTFVGEVLLMFWLLWKGIKGFGGEFGQISWEQCGLPVNTPLAR